ncbi:hypothetical protein K443DRAFT_134537 [Laccaria amethystina LaAM-08-1]|uniref:Uncharacterized protein n=1 Tax=Laccaria amethystina LaAM-08-1 TaxID=1095629 RepID=A0A0C9XBG5_9AGAR|nr:hypothetical protein K443DRAFT_134537 [Laccaria amethystina LaAM-08-1]
MAAPLPQWLTNSFLSANQPHFANDVSVYYGPYTRLLYHLFGGIEVKPPGSFTLDSKRKEADDQMRDHFRTLRNSAFGTRLAFYEYVSATAQLTPPVIVPYPAYLNDVAPAERWTHDLLDANGARRIRKVVQDVLAMSITYAMIQAATL